MATVIAADAAVEATEAAAAASPAVAEAAEAAETGAEKAGQTVERKLSFGEGVLVGSLLAGSKNENKDSDDREHPVVVNVQDDKKMGGGRHVYMRMAVIIVIALVLIYIAYKAYEKTVGSPKCPAPLTYMAAGAAAGGALVAAVFCK